LMALVIADARKRHQLLVFTGLTGLISGY